MTTAPLTEARHRLSKIVDDVASGAAAWVITRHGRPVAVITSHDEHESLPSHARALCARLEAEPALGQKLQGRLQGVRSARLGRSHRILYRVGAGGVTLLAIRRRRDAYR